MHLEKVKAEKAEEMLKKMEEVVKDAQQERGKKDFRISALEEMGSIKGKTSSLGFILKACVDRNPNETLTKLVCALLALNVLL